VCFIVHAFFCACVHGSKLHENYDIINLTVYRVWSLNWRRLLLPWAVVQFTWKSPVLMPCQGDNIPGSLPFYYFWIYKLQPFESQSQDPSNMRIFVLIAWLLWGFEMLIYYFSSSVWIPFIFFPANTLFFSCKNFLLK